jgi:outer membrane protein TolC
MLDSTAQRLDTKLNIQFDWWKLLQSAQLNTLIEQGFDANPSVDGAQTTLLKLQQNNISREGYFYSAISVSGAVNGKGRRLLLQAPAVSNDVKFIGDSYYDVHIWQLAAGYLSDLLRRTDQQAGSSKAAAELQQLQLEATYRTLADNLIASVVQDASLRAQMLAVRKIVAIEQSLLAIARKRQQVGLATQTEVSAQQQEVELATQALLQLKGQFEQIRGLLHLLLNIPSETDLPEMPELATLHLLAALPLELPAAVIAQRPDVRAAQLEMRPSNTKYQSTADVAVKNAENILFAIRNDNSALQTAITSEQDKSVELDFVRQDYAANKGGYQDVLIAELNAQFAALHAVQARVKYLGDAIVLYHALGGGWWAMDNVPRLEIDSEISKNGTSR